MSPASGTDRWSRVEKLFFESLDLGPVARSSFLDRACAGDTELRAEVESLLQSSEQTLGFLSKPVEHAAKEFAATDLGQMIGPYRLTGLLGEGGMGQVYLASRADEAYQQQVAIKFMHAGFRHARAMLLRFHAERQILARLNHPNIARLLDGGITPDGIPYFVIEYVKGTRIDEYCRAKLLSLPDRLQLFRTVCGAVEYAHKNLVVHRDLKPANVLVSDEGVPKLLDFGIAKLLGTETAEPAVTRTSERLMTPEYASPEQVSGAAISTSTDVYALGVLLYELLTGKKPFHFETKSPFEIARVICLQEPERPSAAAGSETSSTATFAKELRGDLDNIALMAMRKEPGRRYPSVSAMSSDISAYLEGYPVQARTASWSYRSGKFIRRHWAGVTAITVVALALIASSIGMGLFARRANRARLAAERESQFLNSIFQAATPEQARGKQVTARELLDAGAARINRELADQPLVQASMLNSIGHAYLTLGTYDRAEELFQQAYKIRASKLGAGALDTADSLDGWAMALRLQDRCNEAEPLFRQSLAVRQRVLDENDPHIADSLENVGECLYLESRSSEAEHLLRQALAIKRRLPHPSDMGPWNFLALTLERKGEYAEAAQLLRESVEICRQTQGTDSPDYVIALHNLAGALIDSGDLFGAEAMERETLTIRRRILGSSHPDLFYSLNNLGFILLQQGDWKSAEPILRENLALTRHSFGAQGAKMAFAVKNWGQWLQEKGDYVEAEKSYKTALEIAEKTAGESSWPVERIVANLGMLEFDRGRYASAENYARQSLDLSRTLGGEDTPDYAESLLDIAEDRLFQGDAQDAEPLLRKALKIREEKFNAGNPAIVAARVRLGEDLVIDGKSAEAEPLLRKALEEVESEPFRVPVWQLAETQSALGACLATEKKSAESEKLLRESQSALQKHPHSAFRYPANQRSALFHRS